MTKPPTRTVKRAQTQYYRYDGFPFFFPGAYTGRLAQYSTVGASNFLDAAKKNVDQC